MAWGITDEYPDIQHSLRDLTQCFQCGLKERNKNKISIQQKSAKHSPVKHSMLV